MSTSVDESQLEHHQKLYASYKSESRRIFDIYKKKSLSTGLYAGLALLVSMGSCLAFVFLDAGYSTIRCFSWLFWIMLIVSMIVSISGMMRSNKEIKQELASCEQSKPGFSAFFDLYRKKYWPDDLVPGEKMDRFRSIISSPSPNK